MMVFSNFDVYERKYNYEEMKIMFMLAHMDGTDTFDYEDCMRVVEAVYAHWIDGRDSSEDEKYEKYPWLEFQTDEEDGYIQAYALRTLPKFIELYKEEINND